MCNENTVRNAIRGLGLDPSSENIPATGRVNPKRIVVAAVTIAPSIMNGCHPPNLDFELPASTPCEYEGDRTK